jgi:hypothetical protein
MLFVSVKVRTDNILGTEEIMVPRLWKPRGLKGVTPKSEHVTLRPELGKLDTRMHAARRSHISGSHGDT